MSLREKVGKYEFLLMVLVVFAFFLPLGLYPLFDLDEGAFSEATREMLISGNYITTYLNGVPRFDKPILIYWLQALSVKIFGLNEFAFRFPSALAAAFWAAGIYFFTKKYFGRRSAIFATLFMVSSLQINMIAKAAIADALLNMFIAFSMFSLWIFIEKKENKYIYLSFLFIGFGTLTKGPVAILIPLATFFFYSLFTRNLGKFFKAFFNLKGIAIFSAVALPWYILEYLDQGMNFVRGFFLKHNLERFKKPLEKHSGSFLYYVPVILTGLLPFTTLFLSFLKRMKEFLYKDIGLFLSIWFFFVFLFFSFSGTKLPHYVIYGYTPVFIFMGAVFDKFYKGVDLKLVVPPLILLIFLFFFPDIAVFSKRFIKDMYIKALLDGVPEYFNFTYRVLIAVCGGVILAIPFIKLDRVVKLFIVSFSFLFVVNYVVAPSYANVVQLPIKEAGLIAKDKGYKVVMYGLNVPSFIVYSERLVEKRKPKKGDVVLTKISKLKNIKSYEIIYHKNGIYLIKVK
ncbi:ArnT family glycosyltransferase [Desulfurobacterium atlanticum]|uniref:4-amino-4-deoxy-L-arabinose transferase n=1 Tax=Desulfurobacterium atlanticum TaxID=240169 RepID=A0A238YEY7_9BACT|nr:glycosyltransferase family 39 protein [Desulfurobacterium atlanticum]SNR69836.1 4-amino-4-deoxy-L-arabinose transferase [Desulfurobacterium atlanticum]